MHTDFSLPEFDVNLRDKLPESIRKSLISIEKEKWRFHPKYNGKAAFFIHYHEGLMHTSTGILGSLRAILENSSEKPNIESDLKKVRSLCFSLFDDAERHHIIEDHSYFPEFRRLEPKLGVGIDLLENDHKHLSSALAELKSSLQQCMIVGSGYSAIGRLYQSAEKVDKILIQHLTDEEEIIIPIFLNH